VAVPTNVILQVLFDERVDATALGQVQLLAAGVPRLLTTSFSNGNRTLTLRPGTLLAANTAHSISLVGVRDTSGNVLGAVTTSFTTGAGVDFTNPSSTQFLPAHGSTSVPVTTSVQVAFSEAINQLTVNGNVVLRVTNTGEAVPTTISFSQNLRTVILTPLAPLNSATQYTVAIVGSVTDQAGNGISNFLTATFTTR
jgi:hypothetical protein